MQLLGLLGAWHGLLGAWHSLGGTRWHSLERHFGHAGSTTAGGGEGAPAMDRSSEGSSAATGSSCSHAPARSATRAPCAPPRVPSAPG